jgi:hypothetical protein
MLPHGGFLKKPKHVAVIRTFVINKLHHIKYTGLFLRHVSAIEGSHPHGAYITMKVFVQLGCTSVDVQGLAFN